MPSVLSRISRLPASFAAVAVLLGAACGSDPAVETGPDDETTTTRRAASPATIAVMIDVSGGFVPVDVAARALPRITLYEDGRVFTIGATIAIYPGPALIPLVRSTAPAADVARIEDLARDHDLDRAGVEYGRPPIADVATTTVTVTVGGTTYVHEAYALGDGVDEPGSPGGVHGLTDAQLKARADLRAFIDAVDGLALGDGGEIVTPERYRLFVTDAPAPSGAAGEPQPRVVDWTIDGIEPAPTRCLPVEDPTLVAAVEEVFSAADTLTEFRVASGAVLHVVVRPVLPHEDTCPA